MPSYVPSLISCVRFNNKVFCSAKDLDMLGDSISLNDDGIGSTAYADAVATYLTIAVDRLADRDPFYIFWDVYLKTVHAIHLPQAIPITGTLKSKIL